MKKNLGRMLLESNLIDEIQMKIALEEQKQTGKRFGSTLVDLKFVDENVLAAFLSKQMDIPCINIMHVDIAREALDLIPYEVAKKCEAVPIKTDEERLYIAMVDPTDINLISQLEEVAKRPVSPFIAPQSAIDIKLKQAYGTPEEEKTTTNPFFSDVLKEIEGVEALQTLLTAMTEELKSIKSTLDEVLEKISERSS